MAALESKAIGVLDTYCSNCHQQEKLKGERAQKGAPKGLNYILDTKELLRNKMIVGGNPDSSPLFIRIGVKQDMPPQSDECLTGTAPTGTVCAPSADEIMAVRQYIEALGTASAGTATPEDKRDFITDDEVIAAIAKDLESVSNALRKNKRYLTLTHLYNSGEDEKRLELYRQAVVKLLNSLSTDPDPVKLETIDPDKTIIRFDIRDLGWDEARWERVAEANPYLVIYKNSLFDGYILTETGSASPMLRADWFAFAASQPPLYYDLLGLPETRQALDQLLALDTAANIRDFKVARAGFQKSGVSASNRMIERHPIATGAFWESYDFAGNKGRQSILRFPLGPEGTFPAPVNDFAFHHDGGEVIFALPNGFHAYYLTTEKGERLDKGPQSIVIDNVTGRRDNAVTNGLSCMGCHTEGIRYNPYRPQDAQDEIRPLAEQGLAMPAQAKEVLRELFPTHAEFAEIMKKDAEAYEQALAAAGVNMKLNDNGHEMINALVNRFEMDLGVDQAAAEFGLQRDEFLRRLDAADAKAYEVKLRLMNDSLPRDQFVEDFAGLVAQITENTAVGLDQVADKTKNEVPVRISDPETGAGGFDLAFFPNETSYSVGNQVTFTVKAERDCFLTVYNIDGKGRVQVIFPNKFAKDNRISAKVKYKIPSKETGGFKLEFTEPGKETLVAVCNATRPNPPGMEHDFAKADFTSFESFGKLIEKSKLLKVSAAGDEPDIIAQKGVVLKVEGK